MQAIFNGPQWRRVKTLVGHVEGSSRSTVSAAFDDFIDSDTIRNPAFYTPNAEGNGMVPVVYSGIYEVDRINVTDNGNASSSVRVSLCQTEAWQDSEQTAEAT